MPVNKITREIIALLNEGDELDEKHIQAGIDLLTQQYRASLVKIRFEISEMYRIYGDKVTYSDMLVYNRLTNLELRIAQELKRLKIKTEKTIEKNIKDGFTKSYTFTGFAGEHTFQTKLGFGELNQKTIDAAIFNPMNKIKHWTARNGGHIDDMLTAIRTEITAGLVEGKGYPLTAKAITEKLNIGINKTARIARTETHKAQSAGRNVGFDKIQKFADSVGINMQKHWDATLDDKTRPNHGNMEDVAPNEEGLFLFTTEKGNQVLVEGPGLTGTTDDINCRCRLSTQFENIPPKVRKDNETKKIIPYQTYNKWLENRYKATA